MVQYAVTQKSGEWTVFRDGSELAHGMSRSAAIEVAEALAFQAEESGEDVELLIQDYVGLLGERHSGG
ncbi:MAG TPA: DUF2188 domain-containing protein [Caulobacteraceae bacterium]|jgi:hypothetical protein